MPSMPPSLEKTLPRLAAHARLRDDPLTGTPMLLYPEGALELDEVAAEIVRRCDGRRTVDTIVAELAALFDGDRGEIAGDVADYLRDLHERGLVIFQPPAS
jgi:pyrroloquinoline quinone biosynthesis protein D